MCMFKSKWHKKYEKAIETVEFWKRFHEDQINRFPDDKKLVEIHTVQKITLNDVLTDLKKIAES